MKRSYDIGDEFKLSQDALDNYGDRYRDVTLHVRQWYDHYVSANKMIHDEHGHPGFDWGAGTCLYGSELPFDLYEWEMEKV